MCVLLKNIPKLMGFFKPAASEDGAIAGYSLTHPPKVEGAEEVRRLVCAFVCVFGVEQRSGAEEEGWVQGRRVKGRPIY